MYRHCVEHLLTQGLNKGCCQQLKPSAHILSVLKCGEEKARWISLGVQRVGSYCFTPLLWGIHCILKDVIQY